MGMAEGEEGKEGKKEGCKEKRKLFEIVMTDNFPQIMKDMKSCTQKA